MATKNAQIDTGTSWGLFLLLLWAANYASVKFYAYPFVYCWLSPLVIPIYQPIAGVLHLFAILLFGFKLLQRDYRGAAMAGGFLVVLYGLPQWADILFRMEGSCG